MLLFVILNFLFIWIYQVNTAYYDTFVSKEVRLLNDGNIMPTLAYGAAADNVNELDEIYEAVFSAIEIGYRHIDTAAALLYTNEEAVGQAICDAISRGIVTRDELFVTAKLELDADRRKKVVPALKRTLKRLQLDYVDLFLIVTPYNPLRSKKFDILDIWYGMEDAKALNLTQSIGVSNFDRENLYRILSYCTTKPAVIQIEVNPTFTNAELVQYCQEQGIIVMAFGPLGYTVSRPGVHKQPPPSLNDPVLVKMAKKYCVTTSQVILRHRIDCGTLPISRSMNKERIQSNIDVLDFSLTDEEVEIIDGFNINIQVYPYNNTKVVEYYKIEFQTNRRNK